MMLRKQRWIACALILLSCRSGLHASPQSSATVDVEDGGVVPLEEGETAPHSGYLLTPTAATQLGENLERCEYTSELERQDAQRTLEIRMLAANTKLTLATKAASDREAELLQALEDEKEAGRREWWEQPGLLMSGGFVVGVAASVGAFLGTSYVIHQTGR